MTDISFTFTGPMTIHIHVYPGAEPPVITTPEVPLPGHKPLVPGMPAPEPLGPIGDIQHTCLVCGAPISAYDAGRCTRHSHRNPVPAPEALAAEPAAPLAAIPISEPPIILSEAKDLAAPSSLSLEGE